MDTKTVPALTEAVFADLISGLKGSIYSRPRVFPTGHC
jgi:hypothetical protein